MKLGEIQRIAVLGSGTMGPGIAQSYAMGGYEVLLYDISKPALDKARGMLLANLDTYVQEDFLPVEEPDGIYRRITFTNKLSKALDGVQFVQETVAENPGVKRSVFEQVDAMVSPETIVVSNASSLNPFELVPESRKANFAAAHWFAPPQILWSKWPKGRRLLRRPWKRFSPCCGHAAKPQFVWKNMYLATSSTAYRFC